MKTAEALAAFDAANGRPIRVVSHSGTEYSLERDVVEIAADQADPFVYGFFRNRNPRRRGSFKWFNLSSVRLVDGGAA